jgi:hypothetical protein
MWYTRPVKKSPGPPARHALFVCLVVFSLRRPKEQVVPFRSLSSLICINAANEDQKYSLRLAAKLPASAYKISFLEFASLIGLLLFSIWSRLLAIY